jgi:hypothetical protein
MNIKDVKVGVGLSDDQRTPSFRNREPLPLLELDAAPLVMFPNTPVRVWQLGECSVVVTHNNGTEWHLSIAHPLRYPYWDEIAEARYRLLPPGITMAILLPPEENWVNIHPNCFQMNEVHAPDDGPIRRLGT